MDDQQFQQKVAATPALLILKAPNGPVEVDFLGEQSTLCTGHRRVVVVEPGDFITLEVSPTRDFVTIREVVKSSPTLEELLRLYEEAYIRMGSGSTMRMAHIIGLLDNLINGFPGEDKRSQYSYHGALVREVYTLSDVFKAVRLPTGEVVIALISELKRIDVEAAVDDCNR